MTLTAEERKARKREYDRRTYKAHKDRQNERRRERQKLYVETIRELKSAPCMDCGGVYPPCCMDYDHIDDNKTANVATLISNNRSLEVILSEIEKCELVCANCHRIRTHERRTNNETRSDSFECSPV